MSIENGARFMRMLRQDQALRERLRAGGENAFEEISASAGASATAFEVVAALLREMDAADSPSEREKLVLVGLVEPKNDDLVGAFKEWYLGNHVEDTYNCPEIHAVRCFRAEKGFLGAPPSGYLTIYEFEGSDAAAAEQALGRYQSDPAAWPQRKPNNDSMSIVGAGWYKQVVSFGT